MLERVPEEVRDIRHLLLDHDWQECWPEVARCSRSRAGSLFAADSVVVLVDVMKPLAVEVAG